MKGTDLTKWQIDAAEKFVRGRQTFGQLAPDSDDRQVIVRFGDLVRLVAWYGQIRAVAVSKGAPVDEPAEAVVINTERGSQGGSHPK